MKRVIPLLALLVGCAGSHPPPQVCEPPPSEPKKTVIGSCPVDSPPSVSASIAPAGSASGEKP